jgi:hypothetical protein
MRRHLTVVRAAQTRHATTQLDLVRAFLDVSI